MLDDNETQLQMIADDTGAIEPLTEIIAHYALEIDERRQQLCEDLDYFESKLEDLDQLDPLDFTGLTQIYRKHASHIRGLLAEIDHDDD